MLSDIEHGVRGSNYLCPIAGACRRAGLVDATVDNEYIVWQTAFGQAEFYAPHSVREFVRDFDAARGVIPFKFQIDGAVLTMRAA